MDEDLLSRLFSTLQSDESLADRVKSAPDDETALAIIHEAGFNVSKSELLRYQASEILKLSDAELESFSTAKPMDWNTWSVLICIGNCS
jgi:predicted ribosomally synthesized peptide with nif11-like leader